MRPSFVGLLVATIAATGAVVAVVAGPAAGAAASIGGGYVSVAPNRLLDTRSGVGAPSMPIGGLSSIPLQVAGRGGVPSAGAVSAVVLNVTVAAPAAVGYVAAYADGSPTPSASNINFVAGQTVPNLVIAPVGVDGQVRLYNGSHGTVQLIADVFGYYLVGAPAAQGSFGTAGPTRLLDTRNGTGGTNHSIAGHASVAFGVTGGEVPSDVSAVVLNVTATAPTATGFVTAYADGSALPSASNLNIVPNQTIANLVVVPVGSNGTVRLYNGSAGTVQLIADVFGYFTTGDPVSVGALGALAPTRLLDTRAGVGAAAAAVPGGSSIAFAVAGRGGVPLKSVAAVVLNVTVTAPTRTGFVTVYADGAALPTASNLNFVRGQTAPNLVLAPVGNDGKVRLYNGSPGTVQLIADVSGYVLDGDAPLPVVSASRYVRNISAGPNDAATMQAEGQADAAAGSTLVLLDIGAQTVTAPLSVSNPGVVLSTTTTRLSYAQLVVAVNGYLNGFASGDHQGTVAVGTNNDGDFAAYAAAKRGADWGTHVLDALAVPAGVTVAGANDMEAGFAGTAQQAVQWEAAYLAATDKGLIFAGSADGCPSGYGGTGMCDHGWTQANYYALAGGGNSTRIRALPQIYDQAQAVQWANIDKVGVLDISFAGALTEHSASSVTFAPSRGWAALWHALSVVVATPILPAVTDLQIDS